MRKLMKNSLQLMLIIRIIIINKFNTLKSRTHLIILLLNNNTSHNMMTVILQQIGKMSNKCKKNKLRGNLNQKIEENGSKND